MSTYNKTVFISKLFFFNNHNVLIEPNLKIADYFFNEGVNVVIVARKSTIRELAPQIPNEYGRKIKFLNRNKKNGEDIKKLKDNGMIFAVIGIVNQDAIFSFNCKLPLFNPENMSSGRVTISEKVTKYGLPFFDYSNIVNCLKAFEIHESNYFHIKFNDQFSVISLNNANSYYKPREEERIKQIFEANLKGGSNDRDSSILLILLFHLINEVTTNDYYNKIDFWGIFPSANPSNKETSVHFLKEAVRIIIGSKPLNGTDMFIRHSPMQSKKSSGTSRLINKSDRDFDTLIVNPELIDKIKGKTVCIIDDYITNGYSAESAKHLLLNAGVKEVVFLSFGKFGTKYFSTNYEIYGDVSNEFTYKFVGQIMYDRVLNGDNFYNPKNDLEIIRFNEIV